MKAPFEPALEGDTDATYFALDHVAAWAEMAAPEFSGNQDPYLGF